MYFPTRNLKFSGGPTPPDAELFARKTFPTKIDTISPLANSLVNKTTPVPDKISVQRRAAASVPATPELPNSVREEAIRLFWDNNMNSVPNTDHWRFFIDADQWDRGPAAFYEQNYVQQSVAAYTFAREHLLGRRITSKDLDLLHYEFTKNVTTIKSPRQNGGDDYVIYLQQANFYCRCETELSLRKLIRHKIIAVDSAEVDGQFVKATPATLKLLRTGQIQFTALRLKCKHADPFAMLDFCSKATKTDIDVMDYLDTVRNGFFRQGYRKSDWAVMYGLIRGKTFTDIGLKHIEQQMSGSFMEKLWESRFATVDDSILECCSKSLSSEEMAAHVDELLNAYYAAIHAATSREERVIAILNLCQNFVLLHPFADGNSRITYALLRILMVEHGEPMPVLLDPGCLAGFSVKEIINEIVVGHQLLENYRTKPLLADHEPLNPREFGHQKSWLGNYLRMACVTTLFYVLALSNQKPT